MYELMPTVTTPFSPACVTMSAMASPDIAMTRIASAPWSTICW